MSFNFTPAAFQPEMISGTTLKVEIKLLPIDVPAGRQDLLNIRYKVLSDTFREDTFLLINPAVLCLNSLLECSASSFPPIIV
jgi:hypothetical protein